MPVSWRVSGGGERANGFAEVDPGKCHGNSVNELVEGARPSPTQVRFQHANQESRPPGFWTCYVPTDNASSMSPASPSSSAQVVPRAVSPAFLLEMRKYQPNAQGK